MIVKGSATSPERAQAQLLVEELKHACALAGQTVTVDREKLEAVLREWEELDTEADQLAAMVQGAGLSGVWP